MDIPAVECENLSGSDLAETLFEDVSFRLNLGQGMLVLSDPFRRAEVLMRILSTWGRSSQGSIRWFGREGTPASETQWLDLRRHIAWLHAGTRLISNMSLIDNVILGLLYHHRVRFDEAHDRVEGILRYFGLFDRRYRRPAELSYEEQRLSVYVRELVKNPRLILMEKPWSDLDRRFPLVMTEIRKRTENREMAFIISEAASWGIQQLADWVLILNEEGNRLLPGSEFEMAEHDVSIENITRQDGKAQGNEDYFHLHGAYRRLFRFAGFLAFSRNGGGGRPGQNWFRQHNDYYAIYNEGYNLQPGAKVKLIGTDVGQVTDIELTPQNKVKVTMSILAEYASKVRNDSLAAVDSPTFIGSEFINLIPGSRPGAVTIEPGGQIHSREKKTITDYIQEYDLEHKLLLAEEILQNFAAISSELSQPDGPLFSTMRHLDEITGGVAEGHGSIGKVVKDDQLYETLLSDLDRLDRILASVEGAAGSFESTAKSGERIAANINHSIPEVTKKLESVMKKVEQISIQLEAAMTDAPEISEEARKGMKDVNRILESVKRNFLIRSNLPKQPEPTTHGIMIRDN